MGSTATTSLLANLVRIEAGSVSARGVLPSQLGRTVVKIAFVSTRIPKTVMKILSICQRWIATRAYRDLLEEQGGSFLETLNSLRDWMLGETQKEQRVDHLWSPNTHLILRKLQLAPGKRWKKMNSLHKAY